MYELEKSGLSICSARSYFPPINLGLIGHFFKVSCLKLVVMNQYM